MAAWPMFCWPPVRDIVVAETSHWPNEMTNLPNDEAEVDADALLEEVVDAPPLRGSHTPPPPPPMRASHTPPPPPASMRPTATPPPPPVVEVPPPPVVGMPPPPVAAPSLASPLPPPPSMAAPPTISPVSGRFNSAAPMAPPRPSGSMAPRPSTPARLSGPPAPAERNPLAELQELLDSAKRAVLAKEAEVHVIVVQRDARIAELEAARAELAARDFKIKELEVSVLANETKIRELEKELGAARAMAGEKADDLKLIKGIGPAFERELRKLGIQSFAQIAAWTTSDIEQIAPKIKAKPDRIRRDEWIARATELAAKSGK